MKMRSALAILAITAALPACVTPKGSSTDNARNYSLVFTNMRNPAPLILNSHLERYNKTLGPWSGTERNGEWEFEIIAPRAWVDEVTTGFLPTDFDDIARPPKVDWWKPDEARYQAYRMPYSSYSAAHLYVEKNPADENQIHLFIQRH